MIKNNKPLLYMFSVLFSPWVYSKDTPPTLPDYTHYGSSLFEVLLSLLLIIAMIFIFAWVMKRIQNKNLSSHGVMKIQSCLPVSDKEKILLVQVGDQSMLIGVAPGFVGHIKTLDQAVSADQDSTPVEQENPFSSVFNRLIKG